MTNPTGGALKASAAPYTNAQKRVYAALSEEGGGTWATYMMQDIEAAFALSPPVEQAPQPVTVETRVRVNPDQERMIRDIVRSAYDRGYNDARNVSAIPGDNAPGYRGQDAERAHSDELLARFNRLAAIVESPAPTEAPPVESQAAEIDVDKIAKAIVLAACELDDTPDPDDDDTILITVQDLEAVAHRHITVALERAALAAEGSAE